MNSRILAILATAGLSVGSLSAHAAVDGFFPGSPPPVASGNPWNFNGPRGGTMQAPEIDPASAISGMTLLMGGIVVLRGKRKTPNNV
jgi:hypothetical protein